MAARALVIESHLTSRRELARDIAELRLAEDVIEAESVRDALSRLAVEPLDACVLGPKLQPSTALGFVAEAKNIPLQRQCAFLAVARNKSALLDSALGQMIDGAISYPYTKISFSEVVRNAIERSHSPIEGISIAPRIQHFDLNTLPDALEALSGDLHRISRRITNGTLQLDPYGAPSPEISFEIRRILERLPFDKNATGTFQASEEYFIRAVSAWFTDRTRTSRAAACEALRKRLAD